MIKFSTLILILSSLLFCLYASAQEEQEKNPLKRVHVAYKYHIVDDEDEIAKTFPKNGHSVQIGYNFTLGKSGFLYDMGFFTFVLDYSHLRKYRDPHIFSAGLDYSFYLSKIWGKVWGKGYDNTPRMERWILSGGEYKTLDKYHVNYISSVNLSYRMRMGGVNFLPNVGFTTFDERSLYSRKRADENWMDFFTFGLTAQF